MASHDPPKSSRGFATPLTFPALAFAALTGVALIISGCDSETHENPPFGDGPAASSEIETLRPQVTAFCGGCHGMPDPAAFPKNVWHHEVEKAYGFFHDSERDDLKAPPMSQVVRWFRLQAPDSLSLAASPSAPSPIRFRREQIESISPPRDELSISGVFFHKEKEVAADRATHAFALYCDMKNGRLGTLSLKNNVAVATALEPAGVQNPAHIEMTDLDGDRRADYVVAELGSYLPGDHDRGKVLWYRPEESGTRRISVLQKGLGRVADVRAGDFDADGDLDLIVAEFGWFKTGSIRLLEQTGRIDGIPQFQSRVIDRRHGTIHVPVTDLDHDGDLDFVALISQEFEEVAAFLNRGDGTFERQIIHLGSDPAYGSSGIELVDLDGDNDLDVLYVNGDSLDSNLLKPYHAVQWLENTGDFPFRHHLIDRLPGACRAVAADLDGDGDQDIVAGAWIPPKNSIPSPDADGKFDTILWFEQTRSGEFQRHSLSQADSLGCMAADIGDLDGDGDLDIIVGHFGALVSGSKSGLEVFWNLGTEAR